MGLGDRMILCLGLDTDATFRNLLVQAIARNVDIQPINLRAFVERGKWLINTDPNHVSFLQLDGTTIELIPGAPVFHRLISLEDYTKRDLHAIRWRSFIRALKLWMKNVAGPQINPIGAGADNGSKPVHEELLKASGFSVPQTLTSGNKDILLEFLHQHPGVIAKTLCGVRSSCRVIERNDLENYSSESGPIHLQQRIFGDDVRIHVVNDEAYAVHAASTSLDYRDAKDTKLTYDYSIPFHIKDSIIRHTKAVGLVVAGWDFKLDKLGRWHCLEVNPMPGFDGHDRAIGGKISEAIFRTLHAGCRNAP